MSIPKLKNYINGVWSVPADAEWLDVENPSTAEVVAQTPLSSRTEMDRAVSAAAQAFGSWSGTPVAKRCEYLFRLGSLMRGHEEELARLITLENGKSLPDSRAEVKRALENTEVACGMPVLQQGDKLIGGAKEIDGEVLRLPLGTFGMIAPFNFPLMVPFWFLPYAVAAGNTYVIKPSEQVPWSMTRVAELVQEAGFPPGVVNVVHGDRHAAEALADAEVVKGISFVGTSRVCRLIASHCAGRNKRFQALGSAKNHLVAMPDAKMDEMIRNMITSCYGCAGQRCMASSAIVAVGESMYREVTERFVRASQQVLVANPLDPSVANEPMVMGPVISSQARQFVLQMIQTGIDEGARLVLDGREMTVASGEKGYFVGPTVFADVKPGMKIHETEIFGPVVILLKADTLSEAIQMINDHQYGNGASIYTQNGHFARRFKLETQAGMIGVNVGIPAPVASLPFGGMKDSLFADIKGQGKAVIDFFTETKVITERYWPEED